MAEDRTAWEVELASVADCTVERDVLLAPMTTFRIGGPADRLVSPDTPEATARVWQLANDHRVPMVILGGGTNVLISDHGLRGIVLDLGRGFSFLRESPLEDGSSLWEVGAACGTGKVVRRGIVRGLVGPEVLAGVPGSMGGAIIMNAGGHVGEIESMVRRVQCVVAGRVTWLSHDECGFAYRSSQFPVGTIVLSVELELSAGDPETLRRIVTASQARRRKTQPLDRPNAGSIFKNPPGDFAGRLIEAAGCKGWTEGRAQVSTKHANFIVNLGGATAADVATLARRVREAVIEHAAVQLELEVKLLGHFEPESSP